LYAYVRRRVKDVSEAQDLTQEFFARLLEKDLLAAATPERGRFRSFLLTAMKNFLANEWHKAHAQKRGGRRPVLSLDFDSGDSRYAQEPSHDLTPERLYERKWALTLLDRVLRRLREEYRSENKAAHFELLRPFLGGNRAEVAYADVAQQLGMSQGAAKVAAHRLRKRYRNLLRDELAQTVADPADIDDEIAWLFQVLG
jgi:RNA polymerase sigma-70 factor (ECF subfamily)